MTYTIVLNFVSVIWVASEIILTRIRHSQETDRRFDKSSLRILWITITLSVAAGVFLGLHRTGYFGAGSEVFPLAGIIVILLGLTVRWFAILTLRHQFTVDVSITKDHRIVRTGIYSYIRHPAYAGSLCSFLGLGLYFANYLSLLVIILPIYSAFFYRIRVEEKILAQTFGDEYISYCSSTKRLVPGVY